MTLHEDNQTLGRTILAANEYIRQLESELMETVRVCDDRTLRAKMRWEQMLPEAQEVFR